MDDQQVENTDRELYREPDQGHGSFYSDSIHVTREGGIGINVGGTAIVMSLQDWFVAAQERAATNAANHGLAIVAERKQAEIERLRAPLQEIIDEDYGLQSPHQKLMADIARDALSSGMGEKGE